MLRSAMRRGAQCRLFASRRRGAVATPVVDIESQISEFPPDQRKQIMDTVHGGLPRMNQKEVGGDDFTANLILEFLEHAESPADLDGEFWKTVRGLARSATRHKNSEYVEIFAALFDSAKTIEDAKLRQTMLFLVGRYIYRQKLVRMDPVNEVEYLDTLVANGRVFRALHYWRSRQAKQDEVATSVYWSEVGVLYHIEAGLLRSADAIAVKMTEELDGYTPPRVVVSLIEAYARQIRRNRDAAFVKQRLEAWAKKLLSASMIYQDAMSTSSESEPVSLEDKLHERKAVVYADLARSLAAIIAARQWDLAAQVASSFDEVKDEDLMTALEASLYSEQRAEESVMPFLDTILMQNPERVRDGRVAATMVMSFARSGDIDDMAEILKDLQSRQVELPDAAQASIARAVLGQDGADRDDAVALVSSCLPSPAATREVVRALRKKSGSEAVSRFWAQYSGDVTSELALEVLRSRSVKDESGLIRLGVSPEAWKYIWYLVASRKVTVDPRTVFKAMMQQAQGSTLSLNDSVLCLTVPAMIVSSTDVVEGVANAIAALQLAMDRLNIPVTSLISAVLLGTARKAVKGQPLLFTPPSKRGTTLLQDSKTDPVDLDGLLRRAAAVLKNKDLQALTDQAFKTLSH